MKVSEEKKDAEIKKYMDEHDIPTVGAALYLLNKEGLRIRNNNRYQAIRQRNVEEIEYIFDHQPGVNKNSKLYRRLIQNNNNGTIFYQRPLRSQKGNVGKCPLEPTKTRCSISRPEYEDFRAWQFINNIRYGVGCKQELSLEQKQKLYEKCFVRATDFEFKKIREFIEKETQTSYTYHTDKAVRTINYSDKTPVSACSVTYRLKELLGNDWNTWQYTTNKTRKTASKKSEHVITYSWEDLWHLCFASDDSSSCIAIAEKIELNTSKIEKLWGSIKMEYASLSLKAINNINRFLFQGYEYSIACLLAKLPALLKQRWNNAENEIRHTIGYIVRTNRHEQDIVTIVNRIIANYKMNKECRYEDARLAVLKGEIQEYATEYYGSQWYAKTEDEQQSIMEQVENLFDSFIEDGCGAYKRKPTIESRFEEYLKSNYGINSKQIYHHSMTDYYPQAPLQHIECENAVISKRLLQSPAIASLRNPMAMRVLHTLRKVINELIINSVIYEDDEVVVEVARELNDANKRWAIQEYNKKRQKENDEFKNIIKEYLPERKISDDNVRKLRYMVEQYELTDSKAKSKKEKDVFTYNEKDIDKLIKKYRLWTEQGCMCIYTGRPINISTLFDGSNMVDIEHTLPRSKTFDDSLENQTLSYAYINREIKQNLLPSQLNNYNDIVQRIKPWQEKVKRLENVCNYWSKRAKSALDKNAKDNAIRQRHYWRMELDYWRGKVNRFTMKKIPSNYRNNQLVDTSIITKYIYHFLKSVFGKVSVQKGSTTAIFRKLFGLQATDEVKDRSTHIHHAIDAAVLTFIPGSVHRDEILKLYYEIAEIKRMGHDASDKEKTLNDYLHRCGLYRNQIAHLCNTLEKEVVVQHHKKDQTLTPASRRYRINGKVVPRRNTQGHIIYETDADGNFVRDVYGHKIPQAKYWQRGDSIRGSLHNEFFYGAINDAGTIRYAIRRPVDKLSKNDIKNIVDAHIRNVIEEQWENKEFFMTSKEGKKIPIRHVRCYCNDVKHPIRLKEQTYLSTTDYKRTYYVKNNESYAICRYQSLTHTRYVVYSLFEVSEKTSKQKDVLDYWIARKQCSAIVLEEQPKITQLILKGDMLLIGMENENLESLSQAQLSQRLYVVCGFANDKNSVRIKMKLHTYAGHEEQWTSIDKFNNLPRCIRCGINTIKYLKLNEDFSILNGRIEIMR